MFRTLNSKTYEVGGAIRNELMGFKAADHDFVIVATESEFERVFPDAERVGKNFPVYLHPETSNEIALSRREKSTGEKYTEFEVEEVGVSIEDDLSRRDFSMNSIARHYETRELVDPFGGVEDIKRGLIKTINDRFVVEDAVRVYRLARFAAEFGFSVDEKTASIVRKDAEYIKNVDPERIYGELKKLYERSSKPSIFFKVLHDLNVLKYHFKPLYVAAKVPAGPPKWHGENSVFRHLLDSFDNAKLNGHNFSVAIASLVHDFGKIITKRDELPKHHAHEHRGIKLIEAFFKHHRFDAHTMKLAKVASKNHMTFHRLTEIKKPVKLVRFYKNIRSMVEEVTQVAINDHGVSETEHAILTRLEETFKTAKINIPDIIIKRGKESVTSYVEGKYAERYMELCRLEFSKIIETT